MTRIIGERFDVNLSHNPVVKRADLIALATEKRDLMPYSAEPWSYLEGIAPCREVIHPMTPEEAKQAFLMYFEGQVSASARS